MKSYLSVDLDFFFNRFISDQDYSTYMGHDIYDFMDKLISLGKPIDIVVSHEELVSFIKKDTYDKIYNVDFHSDIVHTIEGTETQFNEGTWANFIPDTEINTEFQWNYPSKKLCYDDGYGICDEYPQKWCTKLMPYKKVTRVQGLNKIIYSDIERIGVCISPYWSYEYRCEELFDHYTPMFSKIKKKLLKIDWDERSS
jgi:DNA-binding ferritin-like protein (Dps family)